MADEVGLGSLVLVSAGASWKDNGRGESVLLRGAGEALVVEPF